MEDKPEESRLVEVFRRLRIYRLAPTKERYGFERRKKEVDDEEASRCFLNNDKTVTVVPTIQDKSSPCEISIPKEPLEELPKKKPMAGEIYRQILIGVVCNLLVLDSGLHEGWSTPTIPMFGHDDPLDPTTDEIGWIVNLLYVGVGIGAIVPFLLMNRIGRKKTLLLATIPKIFCWIMIGLADSLTVILFGRILAGIGCGITYSLVPMYLGEISSKRSRGPLGTAMAVLLNIGALLVCVIGLWISRFTMAMLALTIPILFGLTFVWLPETSVFLMRQGNLEGAEKTLQWALAKENVQEELEEVKEIVAVESLLMSSSSFRHILKMFAKRENKRAFGAAFIALSALAFCGAVPILAYQSEIFQKANFHVSTKLCIIISGSIMVLSGFLCVFIVRLTGKKPLLLIGSPLCFVSLAGVAIFFNLSFAGVNVTSCNWIPMVSVMIYVFGFGIAVNPIPLALVGEIFPFEMKPIAAVFSSLYYAVSTTTIVKYYQVMQDAYGTHVPIWTFSLIGMFLWILIYKFVPETEGKSLAEIQLDLRKEK